MDPRDIARGAPVRTLIVEDEETCATLAAIYLEQWELNDFIITHVRSIREARIALTEQDFDVVLCDLGLPDSLGGLSTVMDMQDTQPQTPLIFMTGENDPAVWLIAILEGAEAYLAKDNLERLPSVVMQSLARRATPFVQSSRHSFRAISEAKRTAHRLSTEVHGGRVEQD